MVPGRNRILNVNQRSRQQNADCPRENGTQRIGNRRLPFCGGLPKSLPCPFGVHPNHVSTNSAFFRQIRVAMVIS